MPSLELQFGPREIGKQSMREIYGPDWTRDIGEPMVCRYLESNFPSFRRVFWTQELSGGTQLDYSGVDGIVALRTSDRGAANFLGIQLSTASLSERHGQEVWARKFAAWKRRPILRIGKEAKDIGARENDFLPIVFVHVDYADLDSAWEKVPHADWKSQEGLEAARNAAEYLPQTKNFQKKIIDSIWLSLETLGQTRKDLARIITPHQRAILEERRRIEEE